MKNRRGVTLLEMLIVVALIGLLAGITFPAVTSGIESLRLSSATSSVVGAFNEALIRADRRQQVVEVAISSRERTLWLHSSQPGFEKRVVLPPGIAILSIQPEPLQPGEGLRRFLLYPGGAVPKIEIVIANAKNARRAVRLDPITGVATVQRLEP